MPDTWPEPYATIARMRRENFTEIEIAERVGWSYRALEYRARRWNRDNPDNPLPPGELARRRRENADIVARLQTGTHPDVVAAETGYSRARVRSTYARSVVNGLVKPLRNPPEDGYEALLRQRANRCAPPSGTFADILRRLTPEQYDALVRRQHSATEPLAATIAALLCEVLDGH